MQDIAIIGRSNVGSTSSQVRLSSTTITPDQTQFIFEDQQSDSVMRRQRESSNDDKNTTATLTLDDISAGNYSLRSEHSRSLSTQSTDENSSSSESRCRPHFSRDDSELSSVPTSPEDELSASLACLAAARRCDLKAAYSTTTTPVNAPSLLPEEGNNTPWLSAEVKEPALISVVSRGRQPSTSSSYNVKSNRNKPLPVPKELSNIPSASPASNTSRASQSSRSPLPTLSVSPADNQSPRPTPEAAFDPPILSREKHSGEASHRTSMKSMMKSSSGISHASNPSTLPSPVSKTGDIPPHHASATSYKFTSSPSRYDSHAKFSSNASKKDLVLELGRASSSKPASPFTFRRGNSWLGGSKHDYLQERHLKAPSATCKVDSQQPSSSASSSSSHGSHSPDATAKRRSAILLLPFFARPLLTDQSKRASFTNDVNGLSGIDLKASKSTSMRPPLSRNRSKSMDVLQRFQSDKAVNDLKDLEGLRGSDSVAVGATSIIEVQAPIDQSRFSRLLTRKPSKPALQGVSPLGLAAQTPPKVPDKDDTLLLRHAEQREGTLSRLTGSLLGKRASGSVNARPRTITQQQYAPLNHRRQQSADMQGVFVIAHSTMTRPVDSKLKVTASEPQANGLSRASSGSRVQRIIDDGKASNSSSSCHSIMRGTGAPSLADSLYIPPDPYNSNANCHLETGKKDIRNTAAHSRNASSDFDDDFFSVASITPSTSDLGLSHFKDSAKAISSLDDSERMSARPKRTSMSRRSTPPSAYREWGIDNRQTLTKSESDPALLYGASSHDKRQNSPLQPPLAHIPRRTSLSSIDGGINGSGLFINHIARADTVPFKAAIASSNPASDDAAVSDTEDDTLLAPNSSAFVGSKQEQSRKSIECRSGLERASVDTAAALNDSPSRPKSAMELTKIGALHKTRVTQRRPSQATLSIADDLEFLQALEHVRKVNQDRIQKQDEEANRVEQMARLGMASVNRRPKGREQGHEQGRGRQEGDVPRQPLGKRSSSAHVRIYSSQTNRTISASSDAAETPSALELGVGKASGKMQDGAFINDDDWKKEVKALFIIREIVLTERSYARHLEALLQSVRALYPAVKKSSTTSRSNSMVPGHITTMRRLLPQLIALSRGLADRIDANPTAAGVGAAFRLVDCQMEATFVAWSSVATDIMNALRISEKGKSKSKDRIGLISLCPLEDTGMNEFNSVPSSPIPALTPLLVDGTTESPLASSPSALEFGQIPSVEKVKPLSFRRRSTLSGLPPSLTASLRSKAIASLSSDRKADDYTTSASSPSFGKRAMDAMSTSKSTLPTKVKSRSDSISLSIFTPSSKTATTTPTAASSLEPFSAKRLSAADIVIMPIQRLLRILLLLKDLNKNTPPNSLSHIRIQRCLDSLDHIAKSCDKASFSTSSK